MLETTRSEGSKVRRRAAIRAVTIAALMGSLSTAASAQTLQLQLQVGAAPPVTVTDGGAGDASPFPGVINFNGPVGSYVLNVVVGQSKPVLGAPSFAEMDLSVVSRQGSGNDALTVKLTDINWPGVINGVGLLTSTVGGSTDNPATTSFQSFIDPSNTPFNTAGGTCTSGVQPINSSVSANCAVNGPFSMTLVASTQLGAANSNNDWSFDLYTTMELPECGTIGDFVWHDLNHNGVQDPGEPGLNGVKLTLSQGGTELASTVTGNHPVGGAAGYYQFGNVCEGTYEIDVVEATVPLPAGFTPTTANVGPDDTDSDSVGGAAVTVVAPSGAFSNQTIDFGFETACTGTIGNFVWHDLNQNGIQEAGEPGIPNVKLTLTPGGATTTTDGSGLYQFGGLCAGTYQVDVDLTTLPPGMVASPTLQGADTGLDSNPNPTVTTLVGDNASDQTLDFGYYTPCTAAIGNFVWLDQDRDGVQDPGEPGIQGVKVVLQDGLGNEITHTFTDVNGFYLFEGLCAGNYKVVVPSSPPGLSPSPEGATTPDLDSNPNPSPVNLPNGTTDLTHDFGFMPPCDGTIGNFVWYDLNANGVQDAGEPGIANVSLELRLQIDNSLIAVTTTNGAGLYQFPGLCGGAYKVVVIPPAGYTASPTNVGNPAFDSNSNPALVTLPDDFASDQTIDFGFYQLAALGDFVWHDLDTDGQQDAGEPGIPGVGVTLLTCGGAIVANTSTDASGLYLFDNLTPGCYKVQFATPAGFVASPANVGADATDSDSVGGTTGNYVLDAGETDLTVDAGFFTSSTGNQGCTPGYWKQPHHFDSWPIGIPQGADFDATFGVDFFNPNITLLQALNLGGGGVNALARHAVSALLNSESAAVAYGYSTQQILEIVRGTGAYAGKTIEQRKNLLAAANEQRCPLN